MACEGPPRNSFRSTVLGYDPPSLVVAEKRARLEEGADGLEKVAVPRSQTRRSNQRSADRLIRGREIVTVRTGKASFSVDLVNLSGGGAMIEGDLKVRLWDKLTLVLGEFGDVECAVRWIRGQRFGLEFAHETRIDCEPDLRDETLRQAIKENFKGLAGAAADSSGANVQAESESGNRQEKRHPLIWSGLVRHHHDTVVARLRNISAGGALIQCTSHFPSGSEVLLDLGNAGTVPARVCWSTGDQSGLGFAEEFDVRRLAACKPAVAERRWAKPDYLRDESVETSPWASQWSRLTIKELSRSLAG